MTRAFLDQWSFGKAGSADAHSIDMDDNRYLWVMDRTASKMVKYDLEGHFLYSGGVAGMFPGGFFGPHQVGVDQEGNFYTAEVWPQPAPGAKEVAPRVGAGVQRRRRRN